jgi:hypothetical protein
MVLLMGGGKKELTTHRSVAPPEQSFPPFNLFTILFSLLTFYRNLNVRANQRH